MIYTVARPRHQRHSDDIVPFIGPGRDRGGFVNGIPGSPYVFVCKSDRDVVGDAPSISYSNRSDLSTDQVA